MGDVDGGGTIDRQAITRLVYQRLADPRFRRRLTARAKDGTQIVTIATPEDRVTDVLGRVAALGGAANVVTPFLNGVAIFAIEVTHTGSARRKGGGPRLDNECTMGLFLARIGADGDSANTYHFRAERDGRQERGSAELVAVAG